MFRTVLETMRTLFVWLVDLLLFYTPLGMGKLGESWSSYSLIQAAGCARWPLPDPPARPGMMPTCREQHAGSSQYKARMRCMEAA